MRSLLRVLYVLVEILWALEEQIPLPVKRPQAPTCPLTLASVTV